MTKIVPPRGGGWPEYISLLLSEHFLLLKTPGKNIKNFTLRLAKEANKEDVASASPPVAASTNIPMKHATNKSKPKKPRKEKSVKIQVQSQFFGGNFTVKINPQFHTEGCQLRFVHGLILPI